MEIRRAYQNNPEKGLPDPELDAIIDIESKRYALPDAMT